MVSEWVAQELTRRLSRHDIFHVRAFNSTTYHCVLAVCIGILGILCNETNNRNTNSFCDINAESFVPTGFELFSLGKVSLALGFITTLKRNQLLVLLVVALPAPCLCAADFERLSV